MTPLKMRLKARNTSRDGSLGPGSPACAVLFLRVETLICSQSTVACMSSTVYGIAGAGVSEQSMPSDKFSLPGTLGRAEAGTATILDT